MKNTVLYNKQEHGSFMENWLPHQDAADIWLVQGKLHEPTLPQAIYSFRLSIYKINYPFESFFTIQYSLGDALKDKDYNERVIIPILRGKKARLSFDADSIFLGENAQLLDTKYAYVLRLRGSDFGLDLRLDKDDPLVWYGDKGKVQLTKVKRESKSIFGCVRPNMDTFGRLFLEGKDFRVEGISSFERLWGKFPVKQAQLHWEKFYLFFNNRDEVMLMNFPLSGYIDGMFIPQKRKSIRLHNFFLEPVDYLELDEWRFSSLWRLDIPQIGKGPYYLISIIKSQFSLPICRPFIGIFDKTGKNYGYGHAELMPGARNELDRISLSVLKNAYAT